MRRSHVLEAAGIVHVQDLMGGQSRLFLRREGRGVSAPEGCWGDKGGSELTVRERLEGPHLTLRRN